MIGQKDSGSSLLFFKLFVVILWSPPNAQLARHGRGAVRHRLLRGVERPGHRAGPHRHLARSVEPATRRATSSSRARLPSPGGSSPAPASDWATPPASPRSRTTSSSPPSARSSAKLGGTALIVAYLLMVGSGLRIAIQAERPSRSSSRGLTTILGVQAFVIIGGVTRVVPLTGVTSPVRQLRRLVPARQLHPAGAAHAHRRLQRSSAVTSPAASRGASGGRSAAPSEPSRPRRRQVLREPPDPRARCRADHPVRSLVHPAERGAGRPGGPLRRRSGQQPQRRP